MKILYYLTIGLIFTGCLSKVAEESYEIPDGPLAPLYNPELKPFYHGVASGDPLTDAVVIWTRVGLDSGDDVTLTWEVATDSLFQNVVTSGGATAESEMDHTVKVDVQNLEPDQYYFYRFKTGEVYSPIGRTRTLPEGNTEEVNLAVVTCSNWEWGYFNAYRYLAERELNAVLHLGDYIYEYGVGTYGDTTIGRLHEPAKEIISLEDYRTRYSQYRLDPDLQRIHQQHPFITVWDDHEIANNAYKTGAENHQPDEGDYTVRKKIARKVYYEWMPVREDITLYRSFEFGNIAELIMLDERLAGRSEPPTDTSQIKNLPPEHSMLGEKQLEWFLEQLKENDEAWQVIGNQVVFSYLNYGRSGFNLNPDSWDGYPEERNTIVNFLKVNDIDNVVFVTGDTHASWAFDVTPNPFEGYDPKTGEGAVAVEFGTPSVNSGNADENFSTDTVRMHENKVMKPLNPHLKYINMRDHGYLVLKLTKNQATAKWYFIDNLRSRDASEILGKTLKVERGKSKIIDTTNNM